jgi:hypothetical protein
MTQQNRNYVFKLGHSASKGGDADNKEITSNDSKKTGRPLKPVDKCKTKYIKVFCTPEEYLDFQKYCEERNVSGSEILYKYFRRIIRKQQKNL